MMRIDEPRHDDHAGDVDDLRRCLDVWPDGGDLGALDQHIGLLEVADGGIHGQHDTTLQQDTTPRGRVLALAGGTEILRQGRTSQIHRLPHRPPGPRLWTKARRETPPSVLSP